MSQEDIDNLFGDVQSFDLVVYQCLKNSTHPSEIFDNAHLASELPL